MAVVKYVTLIRYGMNPENVLSSQSVVANLYLIKSASSKEEADSKIDDLIKTINGIDLAY